MGGGGGGGTMLTPLAGATTRTTATTTTSTISGDFLSHHHPPSYLNIPLSASFHPGKRPTGSNSDTIFGPAPSQIEVQYAISQLQRFMSGFSKPKSESNWAQLNKNHYDPRMVNSFGYKRIHDAYHMLQTDPSVQRMVISISSDKAVWDSIFNNKAVQDLQGSLHPAKEDRSKSNGEELDLASLMLKWIFGITKSKFAELIKKLELVINEMFQPAKKEKPTSELTDLLEDKVRSSLLLSIVILLIVVITRSNGT